MTDITHIAELLSSYRITMDKIDALKAQIASIEHLMKYIDEPRFFGDKQLKVRKMPKKKTMTAILGRLYDTVVSLSKRVELCDMIINSVPAEISSSVLSYYYINGLTMEQVAKKVKYSRTHCWRLWRRGLEYIASQWNEKLDCFDK